MKMAVSNIAWTSIDDNTMYSFLQGKGIHGLEIAPTRVFSINPYEKTENAIIKWKDKVKSSFELEIASIQSIWYGREEKLFGSEQEREVLFEYTKKAIVFAHALGAKNLVFGCPKNRNNDFGRDRNIAVDFFRKIGEFAYENNTCIGMEANPACYQTNFINTTWEAIELIEVVNSNGFKLNLDIGTMIENREDIAIIKEYMSFINHVHISEPYLREIKERTLHKELEKLLFDSKYDGYVSVEIGNEINIEQVKNSILYVERIFSAHPV